MRYRVRHVTRYRYGEPVILCHNEARLAPRTGAGQRCASHALSIEPTPRVYRERRDYFGNRVAYFGIESPHEALVVSAVSDVHTEPPGAPPASLDVPWEDVRDRVRRADDAELRLVRQFALDSRGVRADAGLGRYARRAFTRGRGVITAAADLMHRIHAEFTYDPAATTVASPLDQVFRERRGVCQDFAHLGIGCLRALGLPASYVSGYLETLPPPGREKLVGADASHAWYALYVPAAGWVAFDPTNDRSPNERYITVARGRDYADVPPLKGVIYGGGRHTLEVSVDVRALDAPARSDGVTQRPEELGTRS